VAYMFVRWIREGEHGSSGPGFGGSPSAPPVEMDMWVTRLFDVNHRESVKLSPSQRDEDPHLKIPKLFNKEVEYEYDEDDLMDVGEDMEEEVEIGASAVPTNLENSVCSGVDNLVRSGVGLEEVTLCSGGE
ncbi:hypothetical protein KI387_034439, partial [Taxus chinensis]